MTISEFINKVGFKVKNEDVEKVNGTISDIKSTATKILGAIGIGFSLTQINQMVEEFGRVNNQIRNSTAALGDQKEIQEQILKSAEQTRSSYELTAGTVSNLVKGNKELFGNVDEAVKFNNAATMLFKTAGKTNEDIAGLMEAINKSFQKGYVDSETISQMLERSPEAVELLNKQLGTTSDKLEEMASSGAMTVADLKAAFVDNAEEIEKNFANVQYTVSDALLVIRNKWGFWLSDMDQTLGVTKTISKVMVSGFNAIMNVLNKVKTGLGWLAEKLGGSENLLKLLTITAGALFIAFNFSKIVSGFNKIMSALGKVQLKTLAIAAVFIVLALIVEDFIAFMKGEDSLFGTLLEKSGVDCEKFRENVKQIWENIKTVLAAIWEGIVNVGVPIFESLWKTMKTIFESIGNTLTSIFPKLGELMDQLASGKVNTDDWIKVGEGIAKVAAVILGLVAAWKAFNVIMGIAKAVMVAYNVVQGICNAIMMASPITWIVMAIVALIAVIVLLIANWDKVAAAAKKCWDWICEAFSNVAEWFMTNVVDPVVTFFQGLWDSIVSIFSGVVEWFSGIFSAAWEGIKSIFSAVGGFFQGIWDTIKNIFTSIGQSIADGVSGAFKATVNAVIGFAEKIINGFIGGINKAIGLINKIPGVNIPKISTVNIPKLAEGGYVQANKPQMAIIGDNKHEGEIVSPISKMKEAMYDVMKMFSSAYKPVQATQALVQPHKNFVITQNIEFNNEFNGDTAIQRSASSAMDKSAKDVTAQLARGLAYAR